MISSLVIIVGRWRAAKDAVAGSRTRYLKFYMKNVTLGTSGATYLCS